MLRIQEKNERIVKTQWKNFSCGKIIDYDLRHASAEEVCWKSFRLNLVLLTLEFHFNPIVDIAAWNKQKNKEEFVLHIVTDEENTTLQKQAPPIKSTSL